MKHRHTCRKIGITLLTLALFAVLALALVACGDDADEERQFSRVTCEIQSGTGYTVTNSTEIALEEGADVHNVVGTQSFVVTVFYTDGTSEAITSGYQVTVVDNEGSAYPYRIEVTYRDAVIATVYVTVPQRAAETLPSLTNVSAIGGVYSGYVFDGELRYNGEEYNVLSRITTSENGVTLADLVAQNKVIVDTSNGGSYKETEPNDYYSDGYGHYFFTARAADGYVWHTGGNDDETSLDISWTIKRAVIDTPALTSTSTVFVYQHRQKTETVGGETVVTYEGVPQGLEFNYGNGAAYVTPAEKYADTQIYQTVLNIADAYVGRYTFLINGEERTYTETYTWRIDPMPLTAPTLVCNAENGGKVVVNAETQEKTYHFTYTGYAIKPEVQSDFAALFNVTYADYCTEASEYPVFVSVDLKDTYKNAGNYTFNNASLYYYIDKAPFPTDILNAIADIDFVLETSFNRDTYEEYARFLSVRDFTNDESDIAKTGYNDYSEITFSLPETLPAGLTADSVLDVNEEGYPVKVTYQYDRNHEAVDFTATLHVLPVGIGVTATWSLAIDRPGRHVNVDEDEILTYDSETTYTCTLYLSDSGVDIAYTTYYGKAESALNDTKEVIQDAGYYRVTATLTPEGGTVNYFVYLDNDADKTPVTTLTYKDVIHINKQVVYDYPSYGGDVESYCEENVSKSITAGFDSLNALIDVEHMTSTTYYRANAAAPWTAASNTTDAGYYKTEFVWELLADYETNYVLYLGGAEKEWFIYPATFALQTTDPTADGYVGWSSTDFTLYYGEDQVYPIVKPDGISVYYMYDANPTFDEEEQIWKRSGSESTYVPSDVGDYLVYAVFQVKSGINGSEKVTVTVDGTEKTSYATQFVHFSIIEKAPVDYTLGHEQNFEKDGYKYFAFTTGSETDYMLLTNVSVDFALRTADGKAYDYLSGRASLNSSSEYYLLTGLAADTDYVLRVDPVIGAYENVTLHFTIMVYPDQMTFVYRKDITVKDYDGSNRTFEGFVVSEAKATDVGSAVTVPATIYDTIEDWSSAFSVIAIAANAFENNEMTTLYLPGSIRYIGAEAFKNCTNLTDIYFDNPYGNWTLIVFGENAFAGCTDVVLHTSDGSTFRLEENGSLREVDGDDNETNA